MRIQNLAQGVVIGIAAAAFATAVSATTIDVSSQADIFLAGQTSVPTDFGYNPGASGLGAGILPVAIDVTPGEIISITATGTVSCCLGGSPTNGPAGGGLGGPAYITGYGNVGPYMDEPSLALNGVFGGSGLPTPWSIFVIGTSDTFVVPAGATTLYLGTDDALGFDDPPGWYNDNTGQFVVDLNVPEPLTLSVFGAGLLGAAAMRRRRRANKTA